MIKKILLILIIFSFSISTFSVDKSYNNYRKLLKIKKVKGNQQKANTFHEKANDAYKKRDYKEAEKQWLKAAFANLKWANAYYYLACVVALQKKVQLANNYIQLALNISPKKELYDKIKKDGDLKEVRQLDSYQKFMSEFELKYITKTKISIIKNTVYIDSGYSKKKIGELAEEKGKSMPVYLLPTYGFSKANSYLAFIGKSKSGFDLFLLSKNGILIQITTHGKINWRTSYLKSSIKWKKDSSKFILTINDGLWIYNRLKASFKQITYPPRGYIDITPYFYKKKIRFLRGTISEYSFTGREYEINEKGKRFKMVRGGRTLKGERLK